MAFGPLILIESLVFALLTGIAIFLTEFVYLFEIQLELAGAFCFSLLLPTCLSVLFTCLLYSNGLDAESAKKAVSNQSITNTVSLILYDSVASFYHRL